MNGECILFNYVNLFGILSPETKDEEKKEEKIKETYVKLYSKTNDCIQFLRKVILVKDKILTIQVIYSLFHFSNLFDRWLSGFSP